MLIVGEGAVGGEVNNPRLDSAEMEDWLLLKAPLLPPRPPCSGADQVSTGLLPLRCSC